MGHKKLLRFTQYKALSNAKEHPTETAGTWAAHFGNDNPIVLELACGRGEYTVALAAMHPQKNFIGVDIKGNRMYLGATKALEEGHKNAAFLRIQIEDITKYFSPAEVSELWITFPDPQLRTSKAKRRLTHPRFLRKYGEILKVGGSIHLKTDSPELYIFTKTVIEMYALHLLQKNDNVYAGAHAPELAIRTHYEGLDIAKSERIFYLEFALPAIIADKDDVLQEKLIATENKQEN
jgi:tRNA (guanine-N7-)-methyltransferase